MLVVLNQLRVNGVISKEEHEIFIRKIILPARGKLSLDGKGIIMLKKHIRPLESIGSSYGELILIRKIMAETQCINQLDTRADSRVHLKEDRYEIPDWGCHFKKATIDPSEPVKHKNKVTQKQSRQNELIEQALR